MRKRSMAESDNKRFVQPAAVNPWVSNAAKASHSTVGCSSQRAWIREAKVRLLSLSISRARERCPAQPDDHKEAAGLISLPDIKFLDAFRILKKY